MTAPTKTVNARDTTLPIGMVKNVTVKKQNSNQLSILSFVTQFVFWFIVLIVALTSQYLLDSAFVPQGCYGSDNCYIDFGGVQQNYDCCFTRDTGSVLGKVATIRFYNWLLFCFLTVTFFTMPIGKVVSRAFTVFVGAVICILYIPYFTAVRDARLSGSCVDGVGCISFTDSLNHTSGLPVLVISPLLITWCFAIFEIFTWYRGRDGKSSSSPVSSSSHLASSPVVASAPYPQTVDTAQPMATTTYGDRPSVSPIRSSNAINPYAN